MKALKSLNVPVVFVKLRPLNHGGIIKCTLNIYTLKGRYTIHLVNTHTINDNKNLTAAFDSIKHFDHSTLNEVMWLNGQNLEASLILTLLDSVFQLQIILPART